MSDQQWLKEFSNKLRRKMISESVLQKELSMLSGVSETTISRYLAGTQMPKVRHLIQLAKALSATIYELIPFDR